MLKLFNRLAWILVAVAVLAGISYWTYRYTENERRVRKLEEDKQRLQQIVQRLTSQRRIAEMILTGRAVSEHFFPVKTVGVEPDFGQLHFVAHRRAVYLSTQRLAQGLDHGQIGFQQVASGELGRVDPAQGLAVQSARLAGEFRDQPEADFDAAVRIGICELAEFLRNVRFDAQLFNQFALQRVAR